MSLLPPVVIGATGGSGTRVLVRALRDLGMAFGDDLNVSEDAMVFVPLYDRWVDRCVLDWRGERRLRTPARWRMQRDFRRAVRLYLREARPRPGQPWGWKNPRSIHVVRELDRLFPGMRYVHVVRDPRDMAFSENQNLLEWHPRTYLRPEEVREPEPVRSALVWHRVNDDAWRYGSGRMAGRYTALRFEDLCVEPVETIRRLAAFCGVREVTEEALAAAATEVRPPSSLGRHRRQARDLLARVEAIVEEDVARFGYDDERWLRRVHALADDPGPAAPRV